VQSVSRWDDIPPRLGTFALLALTVPWFIVFGEGWGLFLAFALLLLGLLLSIRQPPGRISREEEIQQLMAAEMRKQRDG
jgi:uncharacterized protein (DUF58 family)